MRREVIEGSMTMLILTPKGDCWQHVTVWEELR